MTSRDHSLPDDAALVAWLDGELPATEVSALLRAVRTNADLQRRVQLLRAARAEYAWALEQPSAPPPALPMLARARPDGRQALLVLLAAAAALLVVWFAGRQGTSRDEAAENQWLSLRVHQPQASWPLFSAMRVELEGTAKTATPCRVVVRGDKETDAQLADRIFADKTGLTKLPLVLEAEVTGPDGVPRRGRVARVEGSWSQQASRLSVELADVQLLQPGISPVVNVALLPEGVREDFWWGMRRLGPSSVDGEHGCMPEQVGEYRVRFTLRSFTPFADSRFLTFAEPLSVTTTLQVHGEVGAWSRPVDGLSARIVVNTAHPGASDPLVFALQVRNESDRPRRYNVTGVTMAKIPQPFHFDLLVDGAAWTQRADLGVVTPAMSTGLPQPVGTMQSLVVLADYWRRDGTMPSQLQGRHTLAVRFHFAATTWEDGDRELWQGSIDTPPVEVTFPARR